MHDRPLLLAQRVDAEIGDHAAGIAVIGTEAKQPLIAHVRQVRIGAADHHGLAELEHVGRHRMDLGRTDRTKETDDVGLRGQLGERQHDAGIGGLIVLDHEFDLLAEHAAGLVDGRERQLGAVLRPKPLLGCGTRDRDAHADLDRGRLRIGARDDIRRRNTGRDARGEFTSRQSHSNPPCNPCFFAGSYWSVAPHAKPCSTPSATYELLTRE